MKQVMKRGALIFGMMLAIGCQETRYVSCVPRRPDVEARSYKYNDPFPDDTIGPKTSIRPRDFDVPRSQPRKIYDYWNKIPEGPQTGPQSQAYWHRAEGGTIIASPSLGPQITSETPFASNDNPFDTSIPRYNVVRQ